MELCEDNSDVDIESVHLAQHITEEEEFKPICLKDAFEFYK